ncbi:hypothetical protein GALL_142650 [mine drainage metagenome]|uniref:DUF4097 domain-containing protein n=1 Tax=mine drainage metagenome TaxID=410659 RepID=A0A1J5S6U2_9ZZZZ
MNLSKPLGSLCLFAAATTIAFGTVNRTVDRSFNVQPGGTLRIETSNGSIHVHSSKEAVVKIVLKEKIAASSEAEADTVLKDLALDLSQAGADVTAKAKVANEHSGWFGGWRQRVMLSWDVTVPDRYNVDLHTSGGSIRVGDLEGRVAVNTSGGSIEIGSISGTVKADTSGGHIHLESCTGEASLDTSGGSLRVGTSKGALKLDTSGGSIHVDHAENTVWADTSGGSIDVGFFGPLKGDCKLDTSGGSVTATLDSGAAFDLVADTSAGTVSCDFPIEVRGRQSRDHLDGRVNGGGPRLKLDTSAGSIHVRRR